MSSKKRSFAVEKTIELKSEVSSILASANAGRLTLHRVPMSAALKVLARSLNSSKGQDFEVRSFSALRDVEQFVLLYQDAKVVGDSLSHADLLPIAHPLSARKHSLTAGALLHARLRWFVEEDDDLLALVASASLVDADSVEFKYLASRITAAGYGFEVVEALTAAFGSNTGGNSYWARRMRAMAQRRDRKGRFAWMGGGFRNLVRGLNGKVAWQTGRIVGVSEDGKNVDVELSNGTIARMPFEKGEGVQATLTRGKSKDISPSIDEMDDVIDTKDIQFVDAPQGWETWKSESATDDGGKVTVFRDASGQYAVARKTNADGSREFSILDVSDGGDGEPVGRANSWAGVAKVLKKNTSKEEKDSVKATILGEAKEPLSPEDIADLFDAQEADDDDADGELLPRKVAETPEAPEAPEADATTVVPEKKSKPVPGFAYEMDLENWQPIGKDGGESSDYTDDPKELAKRFDSKVLAKALTKALLPPTLDGKTYGPGYGNLTFSGGDEPVPAEALYLALKERGVDIEPITNNFYKKYANAIGEEWSAPEKKAVLPESPKTPLTQVNPNVIEPKPAPIADGDFDSSTVSPNGDWIWMEATDGGKSEWVPTNIQNEKLAKGIEAPAEPAVPEVSAESVTPEPATTPAGTVPVSDEELEKIYETMPYPPTAQQKEIIKAVLTGENTVVRALAGTGKTSTLKMIAEVLRKVKPEARALYIAFNKSVQMEAEEAFRDPEGKNNNVEARTSDSLGFTAAPSELTLKFSSGKISKNKLVKFDEIANALGFSPLVNPDDPEDTFTRAEVARIVRKAVDNFANSADDTVGRQHFEGVLANAENLPDVWVDYANTFWADILDPKGKVRPSINFFTKIWAMSNPDLTKPGSGPKTVPTIIFLDEAQDTNPVLAKVLADQNIQVVYVGDSNQAIYGFRGAVDELDKVDVPNDLPLTESWRFGKNIAGFANRFLAVLNSPHRVTGGAKNDGEVLPAGTMDDADVVLTRSNAGALKAIIEELARGRVVGVSKNTKDDLQRLLESANYLRYGGNYKPTNMHEDLAPFSSWNEVEEVADSGKEPKITMLRNIIVNTPNLQEILNNLQVTGEASVDDAISEDKAAEGVTGELGKGVTYTIQNGVIILGGNTWSAKDDIKSTGLYKWDKTVGAKGAWVSKVRYSIDGTRADALTRTQDAIAGFAVDRNAKPVEVEVSTAHKSKGLQWNRVRIADDFRGPKEGVDGEIELPSPEEIRLAYVAVTRAKEALDPGSLSWILEHSKDSDEEPSAPVSVVESSAPEAEANGDLGVVAEPISEVTSAADVASATPDGVEVVGSDAPSTGTLVPSNGVPTVGIDNLDVDQTASDNSIVDTIEESADAIDEMENPHITIANDPVSDSEIVSVVDNVENKDEAIAQGTESGRNVFDIESGTNIRIGESNEEQNVGEALPEEGVGDESGGVAPVRPSGEGGVPTGTEAGEPRESEVEPTSEPAVAQKKPVPPANVPNVENPDLFEDAEPVASKKIDKLSVGDVIDLNDAARFGVDLPKGKFEVVEVNGLAEFIDAPDFNGWGSVEIRLRPVDKFAEFDAKKYGLMDDSSDTFTVDWDGGEFDGEYPEFDVFGTRDELIDVGRIRPEYKPYVTPEPSSEPAPAPEPTPENVEVFEPTIEEKTAAWQVLDKMWKSYVDGDISREEYIKQNKELFDKYKNSPEILKSLTDAEYYAVLRAKDRAGIDLPTFGRQAQIPDLDPKDKQSVYDVFEALFRNFAFHRKLDSDKYFTRMANLFSRVKNNPEMYDYLRRLQGAAKLRAANWGVDIPIFGDTKTVDVDSSSNIEEKIEDAILVGDKIQFAYKGSLRVIEPKEIKTSKAGDKLVVGVDSNGDTKSFRLDRFESLDDVLPVSAEDEIAVVDAIDGSDVTSEEVQQILDAEEVGEGDVPEPKVIDIDSSSESAEQMIRDAIENGDFLRFNYHDKNRVLKPQEVYYGKGGNLNVVGIDAEGNEKAFTVQKMSPFVDEPVVDMPEPIGKPRKASVKVKDLLPGDVLVNDSFTVVSVSSDDESQKLKPGSVWVTGYYPGHEVQKTKLWYPEDVREVFRDVEAPQQGDKPALSKPKFKDFGKVFKDKATGEWMFVNPEHQVAFDKAMDEYNAQLEEAKAAWSAPTDFTEIDLTQPPTQVFKTVVFPADLKPGDITFKPEVPNKNYGIAPYEEYFVVEEVFTPSAEQLAANPELAGKIGVRGYFPGGKTQEKFWNPTTEIKIIRGDVAPAKGDADELHRPLLKDEKYLLPDGKPNLELYREDSRKYHEAKRASAALYKPSEQVPAAPEPPAKYGPSAPAFSGAYLQELMRQAGGDPVKFRELLNKETIVFFDFETVGSGGFGPDSRPIQISAYRINMATGEVVDEFSAFMNPGEPLGDFYYKRNKQTKELILDENGDKILDTKITTENGEMINDDYLAGQPSVEDKMSEFLDWLGPDAILAGHNAAGFDEPILRYIADNVGKPLSTRGLIDTYSLAMSVVEPGVTQSGLRTLIGLSERYGIKLDNAHDARGDALAVRGVLNGLLDDMLKTKNGLVEIDPDGSIASYAEKLAKHEAAVKAWNEWVDALNAKKLEDAMSGGEVPSIDELTKPIEQGKTVPNPDAVFVDPETAANPPKEFTENPSSVKDANWVLDDENTTGFDEALRPNDFQVGDFFPVQDGSTFHEIIDITEDPEDNNNLVLTTKVVGTDKTYTKKVFRYNKSWNGVRRPNDKLDVVESDAPDAVEPTGDALTVVEPTTSPDADGLNTPIDISGWKQVGGQYGSNSGGIYEDESGKRFYVKQPRSEEHGRSEVLASALYAELGVNVGRAYLGRDGDGNLVVVSPWVDDSKTGFGEAFVSNPTVKANAQADFAIDAWLMNWDAVGLGYDNMITVGDDVFRIDAGGALLFRAQGAKKADNFISPEVTEIDTMRTKGTAGKLFGDMSDEDVANSVRKLEQISPERIEELANTVYSDDPALAKQLSDLLVARRQYLLDRFPPSQPSAVAESVEDANAPQAPDVIEQPVADEPEGTAEFSPENEKKLYEDADETYASDEPLPEGMVDIFDIDYIKSKVPADIPFDKNLESVLSEWLDSMDMHITTFEDKPNYAILGPNGTSGADFQIDLVRNDDMSVEMDISFEFPFHNDGPEYVNIGGYSNLADAIPRLARAVQAARKEWDEAVGSAPHQMNEPETVESDELMDNVGMEGNKEELPSADDIIDGINAEKESKKALAKDPSLVVEELKAQYPDFYKTAEGHLVVRRNVVNVNGKEMMYEVVVARNSDETFTVYGVETDVATGKKRFIMRNKGSNSRQSFKALDNKIKQMSFKLMSDKADKNVKELSYKGYVKNSLAEFGYSPDKYVDVDFVNNPPAPPTPEKEAENLAEYISGVTFPKTGDTLKDALLQIVQHAADTDGLTSEVLDSLYKLSAMPKELIDDVISIVNAAALKKAIVNSEGEVISALGYKPHVSADKKTAAKVGDRVLYVKNGKARVGTVTDLTEAQVTQSPDGSYVYTDFAWVKFDGVKKPIKRNTKYLQILSAEEYDYLVANPEMIPAPTYLAEYKGGKGDAGELISPILPSGSPSPAPTPVDELPSIIDDIPETPSDMSEIDAIFNPTYEEVEQMATASPENVLTNLSINEDKLAVSPDFPDTPLLPNKESVAKLNSEVNLSELKGKEIKVGDFVTNLYDDKLGGVQGIVSGQVVKISDYGTMRKVEFIYFDVNNSPVLGSYLVTSDMSFAVRRPSGELSQFVTRGLPTVDKPVSVQDVADLVETIADNPVVEDKIDTGKLSEAVSVANNFDENAPAPNEPELSDYTDADGNLDSAYFNDNKDAFSLSDVNAFDAEPGDIVVTGNSGYIVLEVGPEEMSPYGKLKRTLKVQGLFNNYDSSPSIITFDVTQGAKNYALLRKNSKNAFTTPNAVTFEEGSNKSLFTNLPKVKNTDLKVGDLIPLATGDKRVYMQVLSIDHRKGYAVIRKIAKKPELGYVGHGKIRVLNISASYNYKNVKRPTDKGKSLMSKKDVDVPTSTAPAKNITDVETKTSDSGITMFNSLEDLASTSTVSRKSESFLKLFGTSDYKIFKDALKSNPDFVVKDGSADKRYVFAGVVVSYKDSEGNTNYGVARSVFDGKVTVFTMVGPEAGKTKTLTGSEVEATDHYMPQDKVEMHTSVGPDWSFYKRMQDSVGKLEAAKLESEEKQKQQKEAEEAAKKAAKKAKEAAEADLNANFPQSAGAEPVLVDDSSRDLNSANISGAKSLPQAIDLVKNSTYASREGTTVLMDSDSVEDGRVQVQTFIDLDGTKKLRVTYRLTAWGGAKLRMKKNKDTSVFTDSMEIQRYKITDDGSLAIENETINNYLIEGKGKGETWTDTVGNATVRFFRSKKGNGMVNWEKNYHSASSSPDSFNDLVEIILPDDATPEDIAKAMKEFGGVEDVRHATMADIRVIAENKILALFAPKPTDGSRNPTGDIRKEMLESIKNQYGVSPDDVEVVPTADGLGYEFLLPEDVAMNLAKMANIRAFKHNLQSGGNVEKAAKRLTTKGLKGTTTRWFNGVMTSGQSSSTDITRAGGDAAYAWTVYGDPESSLPYEIGAIYIPAHKALRRIDWWVNKGDGWGQKIGSSLSMSYFDYLKLLGQSGAIQNEVLFKGGIPWDLIGNLGTYDPQAVASALAAQGITMIGGRSVKELLGIA